MVVSYVLYVKHYKLDEPEYDRICAQLKARRAGKQA
jgi:Na+/melibiose symporter-like transporter